MNNDRTMIQTNPLTPAEFAALGTDSREAATANAWEHDLRMVSVH
jgi:hypothetical protein